MRRTYSKGLAGALLGLLLLGANAAPKAIDAPSGDRLARPVQAPGALPLQPADWRGDIDYRALDARLQVMMTDPSMQGLAIAVVERGRLAFVRGYGVTSAADGQPVEAGTVFRWASISKTVSGTLSAKLAAEGAFSLSDRVASFPTTLRLPDEAQRDLTVEQLLAQQTGLPKNAFDGRLEGGEDPGKIRGSMATAASVCPPGTCHTYQNIAYDAIAEVIAAGAGEPYGPAVSRRLFAPLGMTSATVGIDGLVTAERWAKPHRHGQRLPISEAYYRVPAAAGVNSDIVDLARWMQALMGARPEVLPRSVLDAAQHARVATARPYGRSSIARALESPGYGLGIRSFTYETHRLLGHSGGVSGYRATMMFDPVLKTGVVMLWNSEANLPFRFQVEVMDRAYGLPFTDWLALAQPPALPPSQHSAAVGVSSVTASRAP